MLKLIKTVIMLCLISGVVFFGIKIFYNSPEAQSSLGQKKLYLGKKVSELKTEAGEKARAIEKLTKKMNHKEAVSLNPVDEEDLILTSEILDPKRTDEQYKTKSLNRI